MINRLVSNEIMDLVQNALDASALQHNVISNNIANVDTPGFKRSEVIFGETLGKAIQERASASDRLDLATTDSKHIDVQPVIALEDVKPQVHTETNTSLRNDQNNVDIDVEMAKLAQNTVLYETLAQITQTQFAQIRSAIREGK